MALEVTEQAAEYVKDLLDNTEHGEGEVIRIVQDPTGNANLILDTEKQGDQVVKHEGDTVLLVESTLSEKLTGNTLDIKENPNGRTLKLVRTE